MLRLSANPISSVLDLDDSNRQFPSPVLRESSMSRPVQLLAVVAAIVLALAGCSTPPTVSSAPATSAPATAAPVKTQPLLADEIQQVIASIDQILNRYDGILATIQKMPEGKNPAKIFD